MGMVALRLDDALDARVRREADARSCSVSELLRDAVRIEMDSPRLPPAAPEEPAHPAEPRPIRLVRKAPDPPPAKRRAAAVTRSQCVHRVRSGSYCRRCRSLIA